MIVRGKREEERRDIRISRCDVRCKGLGFSFGYIFAGKGSSREFLVLKRKSLKLHLIFELEFGTRDLMTDLNSSLLGMASSARLFCLNILNNNGKLSI